MTDRSRCCDEIAFAKVDLIVSPGPGTNGGTPLPEDRLTKGGTAPTPNELDPGSIVLLLPQDQTNKVATTLTLKADPTGGSVTLDQHGLTDLKIYSDGALQDELTMPKTWTNGETPPSTLYMVGSSSSTNLQSAQGTLDLTYKANLAANGGEYSIKDTVGVTLLPIEMKVVDRDDPKKKWGSEKDHNASKPVYAGESCGDMVSWKLGGTDTWGSTVFTWTAEGPGGETITGPTGAGKNEWTINDADQDTATNWLKWKPGKWKIKVQIGSTQAEFEQEVGTRTEQYFAFGMIPTEAENTSGVSADTINDWACPNILYSMWAAVGGGINSQQSSVYVPMNEASRVYVNHRLLNSTRNLDHAADLRPEKGLAEACGLDPYKHYRFFAGCQLRFRVDQNALAATPEFVSDAKEDLIGFTPAPCSQSNFAGVIGEKHADSGKLTGGTGDAEFSFVTKNRVGRTGQTGWANLNGRQIPWVFFRFRFEAKDGIIDSKFSDGASDNPNGPDAKDFSRVPTIYVYRRYYDLSDSKWKVELIQKIDENRRPFFSNGTPISGAPYVLPP